MDDPINEGEEEFLEAVEVRFDPEEGLRAIKASEEKKRRLKSNPFSSLPLHRLLAYGRDHGRETPGLAEAVGEWLAGVMLEDGLYEERQMATVRALGERVLADDRLLGLAPWPEHERIGQSPPVPGCLKDLLDEVGPRLTEGLPLALRVAYTGMDSSGNVSSGVRACRGAAIRQVASEVVAAYQRMEARQRWLWPLPRHTPDYLLPREAMRDGQELADPVLRELVERGWDATIADHLTRKANSHPASREDYGDRCSDAAIDSERLQSIKVKIGECFLGRAGIAPPDGLRLAMHESFLESVGDALLEAVYGEGRARIRDFDRLWDSGEWSALVSRGYLAPEEGERLRMWAERDYRGLLARGFITADDCEWYEQVDSVESGGR